MAFGVENFLYPSSLLQAHPGGRSTGFDFDELAVSCGFPMMVDRENRNLTLLAGKMHVLLVGVGGAQLKFSLFRDRTRCRAEEHDGTKKGKAPFRTSGESSTTDSHASRWR